MKISSKGRYGLRAMYYIGTLDTNECISVTELAVKIGTTDAYLEKLMAILKKNNLVIAIRGNNGGYKLSRDPKDISIGEILRCLENGIFVTECVDGSCKHTDCPHKNIFTHIYEQINNVLDKMTLKDMIDNAKGKK